MSYEILDLDKHVDSSEMTPAGMFVGSSGVEVCELIRGIRAEWNTIAGLVEEFWDVYDGFIILSGTDTLVRHKDYLADRGDLD